MLSTPRPCHGGNCNRDLSSHCAHEESGRCNQGICCRQRRHRPLPEFVPQQGTDRRSTQGPSFRSHQAPLCRTGIPHQGRKRSDAQGNKDFVLCRGRSTLYFRMGTRLPSRIQTHPQYHRGDKHSSDHRPYRHCDP